ncbi:dysbindin-like [Liolophura sinensis]|uniref:dysbindin-like n=1 Tax=Liolophura sinensis TaxID=3198878 RepID=UPI00315953DA
MSVFKNIKGTIQSVQQDISTSIKSLTTSTKEKDVAVRTAKSHGVNLDAGADLLHRYQENWKELNKQAEENASKAEDLAILIGSLYVRYSGQSESLTQLKEETSTLPTVLQQLQDLTNQIAKVEELCEQVEAAEIHLENICEVQEFKRAQATHHQQLAAYKEMKQRDVEKFKVSLAQQHAKNIKSRDMKRQTQLKERQSIFQEAFDKDINYYRTFGHTERQPSVENEVAERKLAEIKIEEDASALDSFLESTDVTPSSDRPPVFTEDEMPEEECDSGVINDSIEGLESATSGLQDTDNSTCMADVTRQELSGESHVEKADSYMLGAAEAGESCDKDSVGDERIVEREDDVTSNDNVKTLPNGLDVSDEMASADTKSTTLADELSAADTVSSTEDESSIGAKISSENADS